MPASWYGEMKLFGPDLVDLYYGIHEAIYPVLAISVLLMTGRAGAWYLLPPAVAVSPASQSGLLESNDVFEEFALDD